MALFDASPDQLADSGTALNILRQKYPGMFADAAPAPNPLFNSGAATPNVGTPADPNSIPAPDVTQPVNKFNLPWLPGYKAPQPAAPGPSKAAKLGTILKSGIMGAIAGQNAVEQSVVASGGRTRGGFGMGAEAGLMAPAQQTQIQQTLQRGGLENQVLQNQVNFAPQVAALGVAGKIAEIQKNISDAQKNRYVTPRSGGVYDVQSGQFAPGTEPQDKAQTIDNLLAAAAAKAQSEGRDPTKDPQVQQLSDVKTSLQKEAQPKTQNDFEQFYSAWLKDNKQPDTAANRLAAHKEWEIKPVQPGAGDARLDRSYQFNSTQLEKLSQPIDAAVLRMGRLQDTLNQNTPQADALVAPELLTVMAGGQGSGLRMNEAEISRIVGGRSNWESLKAAVNKWSLDPKTANSITPAQRQQIRSLVAAVQQKLTAKQAILDQSHEDLINATDVSGHRRVVAGARSRMTAIDQGESGATPDNAPKAPTFADWKANQGKQ